MPKQPGSGNRNDSRRGHPSGGTVRVESRSKPGTFYGCRSKPLESKITSRDPGIYYNPKLGSSNEDKGSRKRNRQANRLALGIPPKASSLQHGKAWAYPGRPAKPGYPDLSLTDYDSRYNRGQPANRVKNMGPAAQAVYQGTAFYPRKKADLRRLQKGAKGLKKGARAHRKEDGTMVAPGVKHRKKPTPPPKPPGLGRKKPIPPPKPSGFYPPNLASASSAAGVNPFASPPSTRARAIEGSNPSPWASPISTKGQAKKAAVAALEARKKKDTAKRRTSTPEEDEDGEIAVTRMELARAYNKLPKGKKRKADKLSQELLGTPITGPSERRVLDDVGLASGRHGPFYKLPSGQKAIAHKRKRDEAENLKKVLSRRLQERQALGDFPSAATQSAVVPFQDIQSGQEYYPLAKKPAKKQKRTLPTSKERQLKAEADFLKRLKQGRK